MRRSLLPALALLAATGAGCDGCRDRTVPPRPKAVVLVTIDTLRADAVSFAPDGPNTTPFLATLAADGIVFDNAYAPSSWTAPSMASLFTGLEAKSHGVVRGAMSARRPDGSQTAVNQRVLPASLPTLAESFQAAGFRTVGVAANRHLARNLGFAQGFDSYLDDAPFLDADEVNREVLAALAAVFGADAGRRWKQQPTFLWVHYFDPHVPYEAREPWFDTFAGPESDARAAAGLGFPELVARYDGRAAAARRDLEPLYLSEVRFVDEHLRALDAALGLADPDVLLVVSSDHGEEFGEHGGLGHGTTLYEEAVRVPLLVRWPARLPQGVRSPAPVSLIDVFPTLAALLGLEPPAAAHGVALPLADPAAIPAVREIHLETMRTRPRTNAVRRGADKLIHRDFRHRTMRAQRLELYDLGADPGEQQNLAAAQGDRARELEGLLLRHRQGLAEAPEDAVAAEVGDEAAIERLRQLGYGD